MLHLGRRIAPRYHQRGAQRGLKGQFVAVALRRIGQPVEQRDASLQMANRLLARGPADRPPPGEVPIGQCLLGQFGLREMVGEQLGVDVADVREPVRQGPGDLLVVLAAPALEERLIRRVADQRVFERVAGVGQHAMLEQEFGAHQFGQSLAQFGLGHGRHGFDQLVGKLAAQRGCKLGDVPHRGEPVQPRHERVLQGGRNRQAARLGWAVFRGAAGTQIVRFEHHFGQLFDEQGDAIGLDRDLLHQRRGQRPAPGHVLHHDRDVLARQAVQHDLGHVRAQRPRRAEVGPVRQQQQQPGAWRMFDEQAEEFERRRVAPVQVFDHAVDRLLGGLLQKPSDERLVHGLLLLLRGAAQPRIAVGVGQRQQRRENG